MPSCELCGRKMTGNGRNVIIEGASMLVCPQCASKFGGKSDSTGSRPSTQAPKQPSWMSRPSTSSPSAPRRSQSARIKSKPRARPSSPATLEDMILVEDYARMIRAARQKKKMSQEELAQKVGERISTLQAIESGRLKPTRKTIRGLERELEISLLEPIGTTPIRTHGARSAGDSPTLGDVVKIKRKKRQKGN